MRVFCPDCGIEFEVHPPVSSVRRVHGVELGEHSRLEFEFDSFSVTHSCRMTS